MTGTILVAGASGHLGRGLVHHLLESNAVPASHVIAATRKPSALAEFAARGVLVRRADFDEPASLEEAFAGADTILIVSTDLLDLEHGARRKQHEAAVAAAERAGARYLAYTSMLNPEGSPFLLADDHLYTDVRDQGERPPVHHLPRELLSWEPVAVASDERPHRSLGQVRW